MKIISITPETKLRADKDGWVNPCTTGNYVATFTYKMLSEIPESMSDYIKRFYDVDIITFTVEPYIEAAEQYITVTVDKDNSLKLKYCSGTIEKDSKPDYIKCTIIHEDYYQVYAQINLVNQESILSVVAEFKYTSFEKKVLMLLLCVKFLEDL